MIKTIWILAITTILVAGIFLSNEVTAAPKKGDTHEDILTAITNAVMAIVGEIDTNEAKIDDIEKKLDGTVSSKITDIDTELTNIEGKLDGTVSSKITDIDTEVGNIESKLDDSFSGLAAIRGTQFVPFQIHFPGGTSTQICDSAGGGPDTDQIIIKRGTPTNLLPFIVTGILFQVDGVDSATDTVFIKSLQWGATFMITPTSDLTGTYSGGGIPFGGELGFDIMGQPLTTGGILPHQLSSVGGPIEVTFECDAGTTTDIKFKTFGIRVSGWKQPGADVSLQYNESP